VGEGFWGMVVEGKGGGVGCGNQQPLYFSDGFGGSWYFDVFFEHPESDFACSFYTGVCQGISRLLSNKPLLYGGGKWRTEQRCTWVQVCADVRNSRQSIETTTPKSGQSHGKHVGKAIGRKP
jgi:hypothetical protein